MTANPVLVEATRGGVVESAHRGAVVVVDAKGGAVFSLGDVERAVFPRSSVKALQALALVESGAADQFGLSDAELALACASHRGEPMHVETAASMLTKGGLLDADLECGATWPQSQTETRALAACGGEALAICNNCSGKHAGFLLACKAMGVETAGYVAREHPLMRRVEATLAETTGAPLGVAACGVDGCSIPTFAIPLKSLALAFARFATGEGFSPERAAAAARLRRAVADAPEMVAGRYAFDSVVMAEAGEAAFVKMGAEGVYCAAFPELGLGAALKCDDGAKRAAEVMMATVMRRIAPSLAPSALEGYSPRPLLNVAGREIGVLRPTEAFSTAR